VTIKDLKEAIAPSPHAEKGLLRRTAAHEAGHILMEVMHFGPEKIFATTASIRGTSGATVKWRLHNQISTYTDHRKLLEVILAGRLGEELLLGATSRGAGGAAGSDLDLATALAAAMVGSLGLMPATSLTYLGSQEEANDFLRYGEVRQAVTRELRDATNSCRQLLQEKRVTLDAVATVLFKTGRIDGFEVLRLLELSLKVGQSAGPL
jgi:ATP-dependent Zn protease